MFIFPNFTIQRSPFPFTCSQLEPEDVDKDILIKK